MISFIGGIALLLFLSYLAYRFIIFLLKNIIKVGVLLFILFFVLIGLAATDNLPKPSQQYQNEINSPVSN